MNSETTRDVGTLRWCLQGRRLTLEHPTGDVWWDMPAGYRLPSSVLLDLAARLLLSPHGAAPPEARLPRRRRGRRVAVAYSGGVDSTAALRLLRPAVAIYTLVAHPRGALQLDNALLAVAHESALVVRSNADEVPERFGKRRGYFGAGGWTIPSVLLADHLDLGVVADGNVLETMYLHSADGHGTRYNPADIEGRRRLFGAAGLDYAVPCAGLTEVRTTDLAADNPWAMGCMRGRAGDPCRRCYKCYRKLALAGTPAPMNPEAEGRIEREVIPMLPSLLWAVQHRGLRHDRLSQSTKNVEWTTDWYADSLRFVPPALRRKVRRRVGQFGISTLADDAPIREWVSTL